MNGQDLSALIMAGIAVIGWVGSSVLLAFKVGRMAGTIDGWIRSQSESLDRVWKEMGTQSERLYAHLSRHRGGE